MKFDPHQPQTRFAQRALAAFSGSLLALLETTAFEKVTVKAICEEANYPRATFYNYFDDSYDLLHYCCLLMIQQMGVADYPAMAPAERIYRLFDRAYDYLEPRRAAIRKIMRVNPLDGAFTASLTLFVRQQAQLIMQNCAFQQAAPAPLPLVADYYSNTLLLVLEWAFLREQLPDRDQARECLRYLLESRPD